MAYQELLIGYLQWCRNAGFAFAHIWACPPLPGDDYIFWAHPEEQKVPQQKRLRDWYRTMLANAKVCLGALVCCMACIRAREAAVCSRLVCVRTTCRRGAR